MDVVKTSGLGHRRANRLDFADCTSMPVSLVFLPAHDISQYVSEGNVDMVSALVVEAKFNKEK